MPLKKQTLVAQGAEAKIILDETKKQIIKDRTSKSYRLKELDDKIRKLRTRSEAKLLEKASKIINVPIPINPNNQQLKKEVITMPFIDGKKLSNNLDEFSEKQQLEICRQIGKDVAKLHDADIIHGDLTTSNMILKEKCASDEADDFNKVNKQKKDTWVNQLSLVKNKSIASNSEPIIFFIDFGLGFSNGKIEDKAVDIHLLKQALEAKHFSHWEKLFEEFLNGYKNSLNYEKTLAQLIKVEKRGRYKH